MLPDRGWMVGAAGWKGWCEDTVIDNIDRQIYRYIQMYLDISRYVQIYLVSRYLKTTCCLTEDGWVELLDGRMVRGHWAGHGKQPSHLLLHTTASQHAVTPDPPTRHNISKIRYTLHTTLLYLHCAILYYYTLILSYLILLKGNFKGLGTIIFCNRYPYSINLLLKR